MTEPSTRQVAVLRSLLADLGIVDPANDARWDEFARGCLGELVPFGVLSRREASSCIDAARAAVALEAPRIERLPAAFIDTSADPWAVNTPQEATGATHSAPQRIAYLGHVYALLGPQRSKFSEGTDANASRRNSATTNPPRTASAVHHREGKPMNTETIVHADCGAVLRVKASNRRGPRTIRCARCNETITMPLTIQGVYTDDTNTPRIEAVAPEPDPTTRIRMVAP